MSVFSNGRKVYYGDAYMSAVEAEYENVTGKDSFWDDVNELYGLSRENLDSKSDYYEFSDLINKFSLNKENIKKSVESMGFSDHSDSASYVIVKKNFDF